MRRIVCILLAAAGLPLLAGQPPGVKFAVAIEEGDVDEVRALLKSGLSTETVIDYGDHEITPLLKAAWEGKPAIVKVLLDAGAKIDARASDTRETPLMNAISSGNMEVLAMLLAAGADTAPKNAFDFNALTTAVAAGKMNVAAMLLDAGAKVDEGASGLTPLMFAASAGNVGMIRFLARRGADVNHGVKSGGQTALLSAIYGAHPEAVQALIELKADVNAKTKDGDTPLIAARKGDQEDIVKLLEAAGAKS